jgi:hypothetical protein
MKRRRNSTAVIVVVRTASPRFASRKRKDTFPARMPVILEYLFSGVSRSIDRRIDRDRVT